MLIIISSNIIFLKILNFFLFIFYLSISIHFYYFFLALI